MTAAVGLIALVALLAGPGTTALARARWPVRAPGLGIVAWLAVTVAILGSLVLAGLSVALPELPARSGVASFLHACALALQSHYASPAGVALGASGAALAVVVLVRVAAALAGVWIRSVRLAARHRDLVAVVGAEHRHGDVVVIEHPAPAVYCVPGRHRRIVVSRGALTALDPHQLTQVLAHERAHLRARHHLVLMVAEALARSVGGRLGTSTARARIAELAEMHADDAVDVTHRRDLATAMLALGGGSQPAGTLAAAGGTVARRVRRLVTPSPPVSKRLRAGFALMAFATALLPVAVLVAPGVAAELFASCPGFG